MNPRLAEEHLTSRILFPLPPEFWFYICAPPHLAQMRLSKLLDYSFMTKTEELLQTIKGIDFFNKHKKLLDL